MFFRGFFDFEERCRKRDIYRLIYNYADMIWIVDENDKLMDIFKKVLKINPNDDLV